MKLDQAKALRTALDAAIADAEAAGSDDVNLQGELSAHLGTALSELDAAIKAAQS